MPHQAVTERDLLDQFLEMLQGLPDVQVELGSLVHSGDPGHGYDARVEFRLGGQAATLLIEVKKALYPRDARQVLWQFQEFARRWPQSLQGRQTASFLVAQSISPGAKDLLRDARVGYYDSGGSLFLPAPNAYVYVDKPPPKTWSKSVRALFSGRRAQVLHALLMGQGEWFRVKDVAERARVSPATASQVLTELERFDWVVSRGQGPTKERDLREPGALLDAWARQLAVTRPSAIRRYFVPSVRAEGLVRKLADVCAAHGVDYALTHEAAAQRYAPFLSTVSQIRCRLMAGAGAAEALGALDAHTVDRGANLAVIEIESPGELLLRELVDGTWLASPVQVYLDLMCGEGRAREMAKHLRQERIGF